MGTTTLLATVITLLMNLTLCQPTVAGTVADQTDTQVKRRQAEVAAARFIKRWHETLDLEVVLDEMYLSSPKARRMNHFLFHDAYRFITGAGEWPEIGEGVDEAVMKKGFMAFWNMFYLGQEYWLAQEPSDDKYSRPEFPPEIERARKKAFEINLSEKRMILFQIQQYINAVNEISSLYRKHLEPEVFESDRYKENLRRAKSEGDYFSETFRITKGFERFGLSKDREVYSFDKGGFHFYFAEEDGVFKVVTLGYEL